MNYLEDRMAVLEAKFERLLRHFGVRFEQVPCLNPGCTEGWYEDGEKCPECDGLGYIEVISKDSEDENESDN